LKNTKKIANKLKGEKLMNYFTKLCLAIGLSFLILLGFGYYFLGLKEALGVENQRVENKIFNNSTIHIEGMLDDLAKYKFELQSEKSDTGKKAIAELINDRFANFDEKNIQNEDLKQFLRDVRNGKY
jgi:hypothetical protein